MPVKKRLKIRTKRLLISFDIHDYLGLAIVSLVSIFTFLVVVGRYFEASLVASFLAGFGVKRLIKK